MDSRRDSLLDFFSDLRQQDKAELFAFDDGFRTWSYTYRDVVNGAERFAGQLRSAGIRPDEKVLIWSENRPEWVAALWGCLLAGVVAVPIDYRATYAFVERVAGIVGARLLLVGTEVTPPEQSAACPVWHLTDFPWQGEDSSVPALEIPRTKVAEILFTSGATAEPKGVVITHGNVLANIVPVEKEIRKYRRYARPFSPIRFLNLLPLSHMFGQVMAAMIPPMLGGITIFLQRFHPEEIVRQVHDRRISVIVCVPKMLETLRQYVEQRFPETKEIPSKPLSVGRRWLRYRRVHAAFGFKFWSFVVGAAPLDPDLEAFWGRLGFAVIQGYGLTETAPIVTLNHPFHARRGSVGKPIAGVEVKIAEDGEVLVRGENVTPGYYGATESAFADGWLHTGDIGSVDESGRLSILGRKKEMIVTPEGLNIFPEDVERILNTEPGVEESAVVGLRQGGAERVHAVVVADPALDLDGLARSVNARLEEHQKIRGITRWESSALPRTEGTRKLKRREIRDWLERGATARPSAARGSDLISRWAGGRGVGATTTLDELGLSSLDRVELLVELEGRSGSSLDDSWLSGGRTVGELEALLQRPATQTAAQGSTDLAPMPAWSRSTLARLVRDTAQFLILLPLTRIFAWIRVEGREHLAGLQGPVLFAANHQSHLDTPVILAAQPFRWRRRTATAMSKEFFAAHFHPERYTKGEWFTNSLNYYLAVLFFHAFPLPQREAGARHTLRYAGELVSDGFCVLIYPEGKRTEAGEIYPFQPGVAMLASKLRIPVIPVRIENLERVLHQSAKFPTPGRVNVRFGKPLELSGEDYRAMAKQVEDAVRALGGAGGGSPAPREG